MSTDRAADAASDNGRGFAGTQAIASGLRFAATPTWLIMALSTVMLNGGSMNTLCSAGGDAAFNEMLPMYLLMALFHLAPWLRLIAPQSPG